MLSKCREYIRIRYVCPVFLFAMALISYYLNWRVEGNFLAVRNQKFDMNGCDVLVFLHIQKTGGSTLGRHLVQDIKLDTKCVRKGRKRKTYWCLRPNSKDPWLFSRLSTGWKCGVHADWTALTECVPEKLPKLTNKKRKLHFLTILREPVARYLSEWGHVARGATWKLAYKHCNGEMTPYPSCYPGLNWKHVALKDFMDCEDNLANNRQTRMLADLRLINCDGHGFNKTEIDRILLQSAKQNLKNMSFFGITEMQRKSQILFEYTFGLKFQVDFDNHNYTHVAEMEISPASNQRVRQINKLDIELYDFAKSQFLERFSQLPPEMRNSEPLT